jgi:hypothetical protein
MHAAWIRLPEAALLLASCAGCPPPLRIVRADHGGHEPVYCSTVGPGADRRVAALRRIHQAEWRRLLSACHRGEATREACAAHLDLDVQAAIRAAIAAASQLEAAE